MFYFNEILMNLILLFGLSFILSFTKGATVQSKISLRIIYGIILGSIPIITMMNSLEMQSGTFFDSKSVIISVTALSFSSFVTLIVSLMSVVFRIYIGGIGVYAGVITIISSATIGVFWKKYIYKKTKLNKYLELYLFGLVIHIFMLLSQFSLPWPLGLDVIKNIGLSVMILFPIAVVLLTISVMNHNKRTVFLFEVKKSEKRYRAFFDSNPLGIIQYDNNGVIELTNKKFAEILSTSMDKLIGLDMMKLPDKNLVNKLIESFEVGTTTYEGFYKTIFSSKTFPARVKFTPIYIEGEPIGGIGIIEDLSEYVASKKEIAELTKYDFLTKLLNRKSFDDYIVFTKTTYTYPISIAVCDVNTLQVINETFNYDVGNQILQSVASVIDSFKESHNLAFRIGGDEFAIVMENTPHEEANTTVLKIKQEIAKIQLYDIDVNASFGIVTATNSHEDISDIFNRALNDMHSNKIYDKSSISQKTIDIIMTTLFEKSEREMKHSERVGFIAGLIAEEYSRGEIFNNKVALAGKLHDIGKVNISGEILDKPGRLTSQEREEINKHPHSGYQILSSVPEYKEIAQIVLSHHEWYDGTGYPHHIIPQLESRIIAVADAYDAMTQTRTYKEPMTQLEVKDELIKCSGSQFDPEVVDIFINKVMHNI